MSVNLRVIAAALPTVAALLTGAMMLTGAGLAHADSDYVAIYATCKTLEEVPTMGGVTGVVNAMADHGLTSLDQARVLYKATTTMCPEYFPLVSRWSETFK